MKTKASTPLTVEIFLQTIKELREGLFSQFATKEDLERFATKEDLERFATKEDLQKTEKRIKTELREEMQDFREETNANFERLFEGAYETGETLNDYNKRIQKLEAA